MYKEILWEDIKNSIIYNKDILQQTLIKDKKYVYGLPRGGLAIAVLFSHIFSLQLKLNENEIDWSQTLIVDDIYDSGETIKNFIKKHNLNLPDVFFVITKKDISQINKIFNTQVLYNFAGDDSWILFPWEDKSKIEADKIGYIQKQFS